MPLFPSAPSNIPRCHLLLDIAPAAVVTPKETCAASHIFTPCHANPTDPSARLNPSVAYFGPGHRPVRSYRRPSIIISRRPPINNNHRTNVQDHRTGLPSIVVTLCNVGAFANPPSFFCLLSLRSAMETPNTYPSLNR